MFPHNDACQQLLGSLFSNVLWGCIRPVRGADSWRPWVCNKSIGLDCDLDDTVKSV